MKLFTYYRSSAAYRVRIALNLKGLQYESIPKKLREAEHRREDYLAANPQGLVPALEHEGAVIGQSLAVIEYLDERFPDPPLLPRTARERAQVRSMALGIACEIHPLNNLRVLNYLRQELGQKDEGVNRWVGHWIGAGFRGLEELAVRFSGDRQHCHGRSVTIADVLLVPQMYNARRFNVDVAPFPTLTQISAHLEQLPAFLAARPEVQADAE